MKARNGGAHLSFYDYANLVASNTDEDQQFWSQFVTGIAEDVREQDCYS